MSSLMTAMPFSLSARPHTATHCAGTRETENIPPRAIVASPRLEVELTFCVLLDHVSPKVLGWEVEFDDSNLPYTGNRAKQAMRSGPAYAMAPDASNDEELREIEHF